MVEIFNAISNIAQKIENDIFRNGEEFLGDTTNQHERAYAHCSAIIEHEFEGVRSVQGSISKDKKQYCMINPDGKYLVSYVSIDNIELLDVDFALGSIFGIYEGELVASKLVASGYVTYGPRFQIVFAERGRGVNFFSFLGDKFVQEESFILNPKGKINSTAGAVQSWSGAHKALIESFFAEGYRLRMSDSLSLDTHQILFKKGGIYSNPSGKIEKIFEAFPIALILEAAGGEAVDGATRILELSSAELHGTTPLYFGSKEEIARVKATSL